MAESTLERPHNQLRLFQLYYLLGGFVGFIFPYMTIYFTQLGLSGTEIGFVQSLSSIIGLFAAPLWANFSDRPGQNPIRLLQIAGFSTAIGYMLLSQQTAFLGIALVMALISLIGAGSNPISDGLAMVVSSAAGKGFGTIRIMASIGWILSVPIGGYILERWGMFPNFALTALLLIASIVSLSAFARAHRVASAQPPKKNAEMPQFQDTIRRIRRSPTMIGLALMLILTGLTSSGLGLFENVFLSKLGASGTVIGFTNIMSAIVEIPCMLWADRLIQRGGAKQIITQAMLIYTGSRLLVFIVPAIPTIIVEQLVNGVAYSFITVGLVRVLTDEALPQELRTILSLYNVTLVSLVNIVATPIAGTLYDHFGIMLFYPLVAFSCILTWAILRVTMRSQSSTIHAS